MNQVIFLQSGGSVGSIVVVSTVVGGLVVLIGLASGGKKTQSSRNLNSTMSIATKPFELPPRCTTN